MCFLTFDFELWEKFWQMLQVCPLSVLTMYFLKSSGVCRSREPPRISIASYLHNSAFSVDWIAIICCSCVVSYACLMPSSFQRLFHTQHKSMQSCLENACSRYDFSHYTPIYERSHGKCCMFCLFRLRWCTVWSPRETEFLKEGTNKHSWYSNEFTLYSTLLESIQKILFLSTLAPSLVSLQRLLRAQVVTTVSTVVDKTVGKVPALDVISHVWLRHMGELEANGAWVTASSLIGNDVFVKILGLGNLP